MPYLRAHVLQQRDLCQIGVDEGEQEQLYIIWVAALPQVSHVPQQLPTEHMPENGDYSLSLGSVSATFGAYTQQGHQAA